jgi:hypothetical protein
VVSVTPAERAPDTHWIGGWVGPRACLEDVEKRKFLILPGLEFRPLSRPARSPSLYRLRYVGVLISLWLSKGILFLLDSAAPHKAAITHQILADLHFEVLKHPTYSPNMAPSDYCLFPNLFIKSKTYQPLSYPGSKT